MATFILKLMCIVAVILCNVATAANGWRCVESERSALLRIKEGICDPVGNWFSSWRDAEDCCTWRGIHCDNLTGHVVSLDLRYPYQIRIRYDQYGNIIYDTGIPPCASKPNPSLSDLVHLKHLDLSLNNFSGAPIPQFISSLVNLEYLNLSYASFGGTFTHQLGNLSNLHFLDLRYNTDLYANDLQWLSRSTSLNYVDLSGIFLEEVVDWMHDIIKLSYLTVLKLSDCRLSNIPASFPTGNNNLTSLTVLDLSYNSFFMVPLPKWLFNITSLVYLNLRMCYFYGQLPPSIEMMGSLRQLEYLDLSSNALNGPIPSSVGNLTSLQDLDLSSNSIVGDIPRAIGMLRQLNTLDLSFNLISGEIPESICDLFLLQYLDLSYNKLSGRIPKNIMNLNLKNLNVANNNGLCGWPLEKCFRNPSPTLGAADQENEGRSEISEKLLTYVCGALGFWIGFWLSFGTIMFKQSIRYAYFRSVDKLYDWFYVAVAVNFRRLKSMMVNNSAHP